MVVQPQTERERLRRRAFSGQMMDVVASPCENIYRSAAEPQCRSSSDSGGAVINIPSLQLAHTHTRVCHLIFGSCRTEAQLQATGNTEQRRHWLICFWQFHRTVTRVGFCRRLLPNVNSPVFHWRLGSTSPVNTPRDFVYFRKLMWFPGV